MHSGIHAGIQEVSRSAASILVYFLAGTPLTILTHIFTLGSVVGAFFLSHHYLLGFSAKSPLLFNWHPFMMVLAFGFFMSEGVIVYRTWNGARATAKMIHWVFMLCAVVCMIFGLVAVFTFHKDMKFPDLYSAHSWLGITTVVFFGLQLLLGIFAYLLRLPSPDVRAKLLPFHAFLGAATYLLAGATILTGLVEKQTFQNKAAAAAKLHNPNFTAPSMFMGALLVWIAISWVVSATHIAFGGTRRAGGAVVDESEKGLLDHAN